MGFDKAEFSDGRAILCVISDMAKYQASNPDILAKVSQYGRLPGVYIAAGMPPTRAFQAMVEKKIDTAQMVFIDMKNTARPQELLCAKYFSIASPSNLTDLSILLAQVFGSRKGGGHYLYFDSFNTLAVYNKFEVIGRFSNYLVQQVRTKSARGAIIVVGKNNPEAVNIISTLVDEVVEV